MPAAIIPIVAAAITAGSTAYAVHSQGNAQQDALHQQQVQLEKQREHDLQASTLAKQEQFKALSPNVQENVGGSLTPESFANMVASVSGNPGDIGLAQKTLFGTTGGGNGLTGENLFSNASSGGIGDIIKKFQGGGEGGEMEPSLAG